MENTYCTFENVCRTCLSKDSAMKSVFEVQISDTHAVRMVDFIRRMTSIKIARGDGLPENLCMCCIETICTAYNFAQLCISSDSSLRLQRKRLTLQDIQKEILEDEVDCKCIEINDEVKRSPEAPSESHEGYDDNALTANEQNLQNGKVELDGLIFHHDFEIVQECVDAVESEGNQQEEQDKAEMGCSPLRNFKMVRKSRQRKFQCEQCHESFNTQLRLTKHELLHDSSRPYQCHDCLKTFSKKMHLSVHMRSHAKVEDKQFVCHDCGQKFMYEYLLNQHKFKHKEEKPFPCSKCKKGCLTAESLRRHMRTHEENYKKKQHVCSVCSKGFPYPSFLAEHMKNHTGEKPFLCSICGKGFRQSGALEYHIRSHTGFKPYKCQICNNNFTSRGVLRVHMRRHTDERPYVCDICGMAFRQSTDMKSHRRTHTGDKRALCTVCGKRMSTTGQLTVHLRSHTGEKPFGCDVCRKAFTTRTMLVKHKRIHTGERPYVCNICGRAFNQSSTLKTHGTIHKKNDMKAAESSEAAVAQKMIVFNVIKEESCVVNGLNGSDMESEQLAILPAPIPMI